MVDHGTVPCLLFCDEFVGRWQEFSWDWGIKVPDDAHRAAAGVAYVSRCAEKYIRRIATEVIVVFADEEQDAPALLAVVDVALAGW